ncbi:MAG: permease, partial [Pseudomonadota bacterium]
MSYSIRLFGWSMLALMLAFLINNFLTIGGGLPGAGAILSDGAGALSWLQAALYPIMIVGVFFLLKSRSEKTLREDSRLISSYNTVFIRCAFWAVLIVGLGDMIISFLRVEGLLPAIVGEELTKELG